LCGCFDSFLEIISKVINSTGKKRFFPHLEQGRGFNRREPGRRGLDERE